MKLLTLLSLMILGPMIWQHFTYLSARRDVLQDTQPLFYSSAAFHVITFLEVSQDKTLIGDVSRLVDAIEESGGQLIYAGQAAFTSASQQIGSHDWDAALLVQYRSRDAYEKAVRQVNVHAALETFSVSYSHGMVRQPVANFLLPQMLLGMRIANLFRGRFFPEPLESLPEAQWAPEWRDVLAKMVARLRGLEAVNDKAVLVFNLMKSGTADQQAANRRYGLEMVSRMAAMAHGPMHVGHAVALEGDPDFKDAVLVYYPGPGYFADLLESRFLHSIIGGKQLADNQSVATVPIRALLH